MGTLGGGEEREGRGVQAHISKPLFIFKPKEMTFSLFIYELNCSLHVPFLSRNNISQCPISFSRSNHSNFIPIFRPKWLKYHAPWVHTYTYSLYIEMFLHIPPPPAPSLRIISNLWTSRVFNILEINIDIVVAMAV